MIPKWGYITKGIWKIGLPEAGGMASLGVVPRRKAGNGASLLVSHHLQNVRSTPGKK
jgi:hypothetical protein